MTISDGEEDDYYYNWNASRGLAAIASPYVGQALCRFGHATGQQCDNVDELSTCITYPGLPEMCRLVQMNHREGDSGDSGGPWFDPSTQYAVGIHSGYKNLLGAKSDLFSRIMYADEASAVIVLR